MVTIVIINDRDNVLAFSIGKLLSARKVFKVPKNEETQVLAVPCDR